jgi:7-keto-8-aminopelargonate synthetase-like enzyme
MLMGMVGLGGEASGQEEELGEKLILFSGNDYMGLSSHPAVREAAAKVCKFCTGSDCLCPSSILNRRVCG